MQPRNLFSDNLVPLVRSTTFHVTNSGVAVSLSSLRARLPSEKKLLRLLLLLVAELNTLTPLGVELVLCTLDELLLAGEGARRRETAAGRYGDAPAAAVALMSSSWARSSSGASGSSASGTVLYLSHSSLTCRRLRAGRFSRFADSVSKQ